MFSPLTFRFLLPLPSFTLSLNCLLTSQLLLSLNLSIPLPSSLRSSTLASLLFPPLNIFSLLYRSLSVFTSNPSSSLSHLSSFLTFPLFQASLIPPLTIHVLQQVLFRTLLSFNCSCPLLSHHLSSLL